MKLHLHVKTEYFNAIKAGTKITENRLVNDYWTKRLVGRNYDAVVVYNAYKAGAENRLEFPWNRWDTQTIVHKHFGQNPVDVFVIKLKANLIETENAKGET
jgi:hypothetical protein